MGTTPPPWLRSSNQQPNPQSDYTRQVAEGGLAALGQARQQRRYGLPGAQENYGDTGVFSYQAPTAKVNDLYDQWLAQMSPTYSGDGYSYGQTEDGAYAGFKNQGTLQAAIRGKAELTRGQDRAMFEALDQLANQRLDDLQQQYRGQLAESGSTTRYERTIPTLADPKPQVSGTQARQPINVDPAWLDPNHELTPEQEQAIRAQYAQQDGDGLSALANAAVARMSTPRQQSTSEGLTRADAATADRYTAMAEQQAKQDYQFKDLNPWLADSSAPLIEQQDFAQSGLATPITAYTRRAGADYGVDPNVVAGWFPDSTAIADARDQQTLDFLRQTGMTPSDYEAALRALENQQNKDATDAELAQTEALDQAGYQLTQGQATTSELANAINLPVEDVYAILDGADYQYAQSAINDALTTQDLGYIEETVTQMLDAAATTDPAMLNILQTIYKDYIPDGYDLYGSR